MVILHASGGEPTAIDEREEAPRGDHKSPPDVKVPHCKVRAGERNRKNRREIRKVPTPRQGFAGRMIDFQKWAATPRGRLDVRTSRAARRASESTPGWTSTSQTGVTASIGLHASGSQPGTTATKPGGAALDSVDLRASGAGPASRSCLHENSPREWRWTVGVDRRAARPQNHASSAQTYPLQKDGPGDRTAKTVAGSEKANLHASEGESRW